MELNSFCAAVVTAKDAGKSISEIAELFNLSRQTVRRILDYAGVYRQPPRKGTSICINCKNACGGCCWSEYDPVSKKIRFEPVPGWTAEESIIHMGGHGERPVKTFYITACPLFEEG